MTDKGDDMDVGEWKGSGNDFPEESDDVSFTLREAPKKKRKTSGGRKRKKKAGTNKKVQDNKNQVVVEQSDEDAALVQAAIGE